MEVPDHVNHVWCFEADEDGVEKLLFGFLTKQCFFLQAYVRSSFPAVCFPLISRVILRRRGSILTTQFAYINCILMVKKKSFRL